MADKSGHVQDELALVGQYKAGFTGKVPTEFSKPTAFDIKPGYEAEGQVRQAFGFAKQESHPTPTAPGKGTV